jgi:ribonuclease BN (tRNA processing enzyme)
MTLSRYLFGCTLLICLLPAHAQEGCGRTTGVQVQVLGSGGPEVEDKRASSSYLIWIDGKARVLLDAGGGSALRFGESGAHTGDLDVILLSHLHVDHTADLPALIKSSWFGDRERPLPIYGPARNKFMPSTIAFVRGLFDPVRGVYRYLGEFLSPMDKNTYKLKPYDVAPINVTAMDGSTRPVYSNGRLRVYATSVEHGRVPALAWRVQAAGKSVTYSGDMNGTSGNLETLAKDTDLLIAHNAIPEDAGVVEHQLHMPPSVIGRIAKNADVRSLVLSHRMLRTLGREDETLALIKKSYTGPVTFANDLDCYQP